MIYLASTSPRRKKILKDAQIPFRTLSPKYEEKSIPGLGPSKLVRTHALGKALSAASLIQEGTVLSADTIVYFRGKIIGKPRDARHAVGVLSSLQGNWHEVYTGVTLLKVRNQKIFQSTTFVEKTKIRLCALSQKEIESYFKRINPLDKAGAYAIQAKRKSIVEEVQGSFLNAVGLPLERIKDLLQD